MAGATLVLSVPDELKKQLAWLAAATGRGELELALEALQQYIDFEKREVGILLGRIVQADAGNFATDEEVRQTFERLKAKTQVM